jgi:hypothetical protein
MHVHLPARISRAHAFGAKLFQNSMGLRQRGFAEGADLAGEPHPRGGGSFAAHGKPCRRRNSESLWTPDLASRGYLPCLVVMPDLVEMDPMRSPASGTIDLCNLCKSGFIVRRLTMANRYGEAAFMVARQKASADIDPVARWEGAMESLYPTSPTARNKRCPRGAFLGLAKRDWLGKFLRVATRRRKTTRLMQFVPWRSSLKDGKTGRPTHCGVR